MVGSQGEHDAPAHGVGDQSLEEPTTLVLVLAQGEGLLGLVDEHDRVQSHSGGGERVHRVAPGGEDGRVGAVAS